MSIIINTIIKGSVTPPIRTKSNITNNVHDVAEQPKSDEQTPSTAPTTK